MRLSFGRIMAFCLLLVLVSTAFAAQDKAVKIVSSTSSYIDLQFKLPQMEIKTVSGKDGQYQEYILDGAEYSVETGLPSLPFFTATIAIPATGNVEHSFNDTQSRWLEASRPVPAQDKDDVKTEDWVIDHKLYNGRGVYPSQALSVSEPGILRDFRIVTVNLYPLQWDAATSRMKVTETANVRINFTGGVGANELRGFTGSYSPVFTSLYEQTIDNFDLYRDEDMAPVNPKILLIYGGTPSTDFQTRLTDLVTWKRQKGYLVSAVGSSTTGTSTTSIKAYIQTQYDNPDTRPDFLILLGDVNGTYPIPSWGDTWSGYNGEGDYTYTKLAGNDEIGDCFIGRISVSDLSQLDIYLAKIYQHEKNISLTMPQAGWLNRMLLVGDPSHSGVSTITSNKFIKEIAKQINPDYTFTEVYGGNFSTLMNGAISGGVGLMNYRGYLGMSGWSPGSSLTNSNKLPHAVIITCGTGSYNSTSPTESFIRLGTSANPLGAATAIGMATTGTHTGFNNSLTLGIFQGIYGSGMRTMGEALLAGRANIEKHYGVSNPTQAHYFAHWCNLMGDPTLEVFTSVPGTLTMNTPASMPAGTRQLEINLLDGNGTPVRYASVTAYTYAAGVVTSGFTDANGDVLLTLPNAISGTLKITAAKHNFKPVQADITIDGSGSVVIDAISIDDDSNGQSIGNGDFMLNAGETVECSFSMRNTAQAAFANLTGTLTTTNPNVTITSGTTSFPILQPGFSVLNTTPFVFSVVNDISSSEDIRLVLNVTDGTTSWDLFYHINASNLRFTPSQITVVNGSNSVLDPGETAQLRVVLQNLTSLTGTAISAEITSLSDMVAIQDSVVVYGDIIPNSTANPQTDFVIIGRPQLIPGMIIPMQVRVYNTTGFSQVLSFNLPIGTPSQHTPLGPDAYGYFIYDVTDTAYPDVPQYSWIETAPSLGGSGISLNLDDEGVSGNEGDQDTTNNIAVVDLPFPFGFYGVEYNQISVCTNGYIAMGVTENHEFRNYHLPGPGGASPMIAAFWDDLCTNGGGQVYKYYDAAQHTFIIQYQNMKNGYNRTSEETFQVIFYDPAFYPSGLGDGTIKIQYKVFNNIDIGATGYSPGHGNYCSIGIKNLNNSEGLEYTYNNVYPAAAAPLGNQTALLITTIPVIHQAPYLVVAETYIQDSNHNNLVEPGDILELGIQLNNLGTNPAVNGLLTISESDPYVTVINDTTSYNLIPGSGTAMNNSAIIVQISPDCPDAHTITLNCHIAITGNAWDRQISLVVQKPSVEFMSYFINDYTANGNGLADPGETFVLAVNLSNPTDLPATHVTAALSSTNPNVTVNTAQADFYTIPPHTVIQKAFSVSFTFGIPLNSFVPFTLSFTGDMITPSTEELSVGCGVSGLSMDFEQTNGNMVTNEPNGWAWGTDTTAGAHSGTKVWGTVLNGEYPVNSHFELVSPDAVIGSGSWLEFYHWYSVESGWDGGNVKISTDNGQNWELLTPENGYPETSINALSEPGYSGTMTTWTLTRFNLSSYQNSTVRIKWTFGSDTMINGQGWYIDDVNFTGALTSTGQVNGVVSLGSTSIPLTEVVVGSNRAIATHPEADGSYVIYLAPDTYNLTAALTGHMSDAYNNFVISPANPMLIHDFYLAYFIPVRQINPSNVDGTVHLDWTAPQDPEFPVVNYKIYKRFNTGGFELLTQTTETGIVETLTDLGLYQYYMIVNYGVGESVSSDTLNLRIPYLDEEDNHNTPVVTALLGNYPNPFNPTTTFAFDLSKSGLVRLHIYNLKGQLVKTLVDNDLKAGQHTMVWNGRDNNGKTVGSGMYLYRLQAKGYTKTMKAMLLK